MFFCWFFLFLSLNLYIFNVGCHSFSTYSIYKGWQHWDVLSCPIDYWKILWISSILIRHTVISIVCIHCILSCSHLFCVYIFFYVQHSFFIVPMCFFPFVTGHLTLFLRCLCPVIFLLLVFEFIFYCSKVIPFHFYVGSPFCFCLACVQFYFYY